MYGIIYKTTNNLNNKIYIGQTTKPLDERIKKHIKSNHTYFQLAINKYGKNNFIFEIIDKANNKAELDYLEKIWIRYHKSNKKEYGYNLTNGGEGGVPNDEVRKKLSKRQIGKLNHSWKGGKKAYICIICKKKILDYKYRKYCSRVCCIKGQVGKGNPFYGKKHSNSTIEVLKIKQIKTEEIKEKMSKSHKERYKLYTHPRLGKLHTMETKQKMKEKAIERFKDKNNHPMYGKKHTILSIEKNRQSNIDTHIRKKLIKLKGE